MAQNSKTLIRSLLLLLSAASFLGCETLVSAPIGDGNAVAPNGSLDPANPDAPGGTGDPTDPNAPWSPNPDRPDLDPVDRPLPPRGGEVSGKPASLVQERLYACAEEPVTYTPQRIWRLNSDQWRRNAYDLAASSNAPGVNDPFGFSPSGATFNNYAGAFSIAESQLAGVLSSGRAAAIAALNDNKFNGTIRALYRDVRNNGEPSNPLDVFTESHANSIINNAFDYLIQRDPTPEEHTELNAAMLELVETIGVERGIVASIVLVFGLPDALFRREIGVIEPGSDRAILTPYEIAASLSYTLRRESPRRAGLLDEVEDESILNPGTQKSIIEDLADPENSSYAGNMRDFMLEYFQYDVGGGIQKDGQRANEFTEAYRSLDNFVKYAIREDSQFLQRTLASTDVFDTSFRLEDATRDVYT
ncbi:MAG: DUF1592 domain-containing protein, partial [Myxococcota bacterium]